MNSTLRDVFVSCDSIGVRSFTFTRIVSKGIFANQIFLIVFNSILAFVTAMMNALAVLTIRRSSLLREKPCYFIILLQSSIDIICSLVAMPFFLVYLVNAVKGTVNCLVNALGLLLLLSALGYSSINLFALTWERYIAILYPYDYNSKVTKTKLLIGVSLAGLVDCLMKTGVLVLTHEIIFRFTILEVTVLFCYVCFAYTRIYFVVRNSRKILSKPTDLNNDLSKRTKTKIMLQEVKTAKSCFIVVLCFFLLYVIPGFFFNIIDWKKIDQFLVAMWITTLAYCNSSVNSLIFFWSRVMLRKEAIKFIQKIGNRESQ